MDLYCEIQKHYLYFSQGEMELTPAVYAHFIYSLMGLANGKIGVILEVCTTFLS